MSNQKQIARKSKAPVDLGKDVNDPLTWPTYTGRVTLVVTKEVFDLAGKVLVVSAFSVLASLSSPEAAKWVPGVLAVLLGLHVTYRTDVVIAELFAWMKAKGPAMLLFYTVLTATIFVFVTLTALIFLTHLAMLVAAVIR